MDCYSVFVYDKFRSFVIAYIDLDRSRANRLYTLAKNRVNTGFVFLKQGSCILKKFSHISA